jgi:hypothetical protein
MSRQHTPDLNDMWVRAKLGTTTEGRRALDHWALAHAATNPHVRRNHKRAARRIATRALASSD